MKIINKPPRRINMIGKTFWKLMVTGFSHVDYKREAFWKCTCLCGKEKILSGGSLRRGEVITCGDCSKNIFIKEKNYITGITKTGDKFIFNNEDYELVKNYTWHKVVSGYFSSPINGKDVLLHRLILKANQNENVDHINGDKNNYLRNNLRICTRQQNTQNQTKTRGTSRYKGVSWCKYRNKWVARIRNKHIGYFDKENDAAEAYNKKAIELFGEFARINVIGGNEYETTSVLSYA